MKAIDLSKQQALDVDPKAIHQINFIVELDRAGQTAMYFILKETKETVLGFLRGTVRVLLPTPLGSTVAATATD